MNVSDSSTEGLARNPAPLFASSWMALFLLIRDQLLLPAPASNDGSAEDPKPDRTDFSAH